MTLNVGLAIIMVVFPLLIPLLCVLLDGVGWILDCFDQLFDRRRRARK